MLVIIEGADATGKTTLATSVFEHLLDAGRPVCQLHAEAPKEHPLDEYTAGLATRVKTHDVVLDRWHLGELVYGPLYRGRCGLTETQFAAVEEYLDALGAVVVYCTARRPQIVSRLLARSEPADIPQIERELIAWATAIAKTRLPVLWSPAGVEVDAAEVIDFARIRERTLTDA